MDDIPCKSNDDFWAVCDIFLEHASKVVVKSIYHSPLHNDQISGYSNFILKHIPSSKTVVLSRFHMHNVTQQNLTSSDEPILKKRKARSVSEEEFVRILKHSSFSQWVSIIIVWSPQVFNTFLSFTHTRFPRNLHIVFLLQDDFSEVYASTVLKHFWESNILNSMVLAPCSVYYNYAYIYDPFFPR